MESNTVPDVYSRNAIEFVTVAKEYCAFLENAGRLKGMEFMDNASKILPLLYLKASMLPSFEPVSSGGNEKFVTEEDYNYIRETVAQKLGSYEVFVDIYQPLMRSETDSTSVSLSEVFTDIYQDTRDLLALYVTGVEEIMNDGLWECRLNFEQFWGPRLIAGMAVLHNILYGAGDTEEAEK